MPTIALLHTVPLMAPRFKALLADALPGWTSFNMADESLLSHTISEGSVSMKTRQRLTGHIFSAVDAGADAVLVTCSTLGDVVDQVAPLLDVPLFRIDRGMAIAATRSASRIGVLATLPTTLAPTARLLAATAAAAGRQTEIASHLCAGAFDALMAGDRAAHDAAVIEGYRRLAGSVDLIVLAQASMADALTTLPPPDLLVPVLTSPELGVAYVADRLKHQFEAQA